jgi:hypothetical protein
VRQARRAPQHVSIADGRNSSHCASTLAIAIPVRVPRLHRPTTDRRSARPHLGRHRPRGRPDARPPATSRHRQHAPLKTEADRRKVMLAPRSPRACANAGSPVATRRRVTSCSAAHSGLEYRDAGEAFRQAVKRAGAAGAGKADAALAPSRFRLAPDRERPERRLRHPPARSRKPKHHPEVYAHLFDRADHAATARDELETSYAATVGPGV